MDWLIPTEVKAFHDEPPKSHCLTASQPESYGYHHFKTINIVAYPVVLSDVPHRFLFQQFIVLVNGSNSLTDVTAEHVERIAHLLLRHLYGSGRHRDRPVFTDCNDSPVHSPYLVLESTFRTLVISRKMELSNTRA